jgi:hypothetical protein
LHASFRDVESHHAIDVVGEPERPGWVGGGLFWSFRPNHSAELRGKTGHHPAALTEALSDALLDLVGRGAVVRFRASGRDAGARLCS